MKDGDVSLFLKNVTTDDTGTYECRVVQGGNKRRKRSHLDSDTISIIQLDFSPPGKKDEQQDGGKEDEQQPDGGKKDGQPDGGGLIVGVLVGVTVSVVLVSLVGGFLVSKHQRRLSQEQNPPPAAEHQPMNAENRPQAET
ncbi:hypothetical protein CHARACLAT_033443 [Characodon lateralis]|uniref:Ig-like domain-containing protein n=1 Tax=Characodon lateralis TaxID=208331 RepID=A0ABU7DLX6_9TELE|nr:hypothetical protein [Characodon lateralis]